MDDDVRASGTDRYAVSQAYRWKAERDKAMQELRQLKDSSLDTTVSAYDLLPEEERDAITWVREHGGLDAVKELLDWVVGHCSTKQQLDFDFWLSGRVMHELGFDEDMADRDEVERRLLARLMPEGYEWPRFEDGARVKFGDVVSDGDETGRVYYVTFDAVNPVIIGFTDETPDQDPGTWLEVSVSDGERVRRPAPKVLDADGVEIEVGDDLYSVEGMLKFHVSAIDKKNGRIATEAMFALDKWADPKMYTHLAPVLAADGRPLREGEHVYHVETGAELVVKRLPKPVEYQAVVVFALPTSPASHLTSFDPDRLTHERPIADTWERLDEDAEKDPCGYFGFDGEETCGKCPASGKNCVQTMAQDLVRRCRALAERERGE